MVEYGIEKVSSVTTSGMLVVIESAPTNVHAKEPYQALESAKREIKLEVI